MISRKLLIVSNFFYPEITPRAFRTYELVKEFCKQGDKVTLILPNKDIYHNNPVNIKNLTILFSVSEIKKTDTTATAPIHRKKRESTVIKKLKRVVLYFFPREIYFFYNKGIITALSGISESFDSIISIAQPLGIHLTVTMALRKNKYLRKTVRIAEFSDPMFHGQLSRTFPANWLYGYLFSSAFHYFVIPVESAIGAYTRFKSKANIKVIPQGFDLSDYDIAEYKPNGRITFAYAGSFYPDLRDPRYFLDHLLNTNTDFLFKLYIPKRSLFFESLIQPYKEQLKDKLQLYESIPRKELIYELSKADFLINFNNENAQMVPSKLIDYAIAGRPIISFNSRTFREKDFLAFMGGNYSDAVRVNVSDYDIKNVVSSFKSIIHSSGGDKELN